MKQALSLSLLVVVTALAVCQLVSQADEGPAPKLDVSAARQSQVDADAARDLGLQLDALRAEYHAKRMELKVLEEDFQLARTRKQKELDRLLERWRAASAAVNGPQAAEKHLERVADDLRQMIKQYPETPASNRARQALQSLEDSAARATPE